MKPEEFKEIVSKLNVVAKVFGSRGVDPSTYPVWQAVVEQHQTSDVVEFLDRWAVEKKAMLRPVDLREHLERLKSERLQAFSNKYKSETTYDSTAISPKQFEAFLEVVDRVKGVGSGNPLEWAYRNRVLEAYGFPITPVLATWWRKALGLDPCYRFDNDERMAKLPVNDRSKIKPSRADALLTEAPEFWSRYKEAHGFNLVIDPAFYSR